MDRSPFDGDEQYEAFFETLARSLHRSQPRHVLLVRERGVAEQAVLLEFVRRGSVQGVPPFLRDKRVLAVDCRHLTADEVRPARRALFSAVTDGDDLIVCVDGLAALLGGRADGRPALLASLSQAKCRVVGIVTPREYEEHFAADADSRELFAPVHLHEPAGDLAVALTRHFARGLEQQYGLRIDDEAVGRAVALSDGHILHERLPYKAVRVLRGACDDLDFDRSQRSGTRDRVTEADVVAKVAHLTGVSEATVAGVGEGTDYGHALADVIVGQPHAVGEVATELGLIKAGMTDPGKPASVMMFIGQTGTGKTEMAKALARMYSSSGRLKTFTLGNFSEPHSVSGIIGVPPGYVGHEQGGRLVNELNADPYGVFLLDEADKAHPDVMQPFLNLFDEGWIADQRGNRAYANRALFILTTNVGQRQIADLCRAGKGSEEITAAMKESLARIRHSKSNRPVFTPEFMARVKRVVVFRTLDEPAMVGIAHRLVEGVRREWTSKRRKALEVAPALVDAIGRVAFAVDDRSQGREGGRVVRRLLADVVEAAIHRAINGDPKAYRAASRVTVDYPTAGDNTTPPATTPTAQDLLGRVGVRFA